MPQQYIMQYTAFREAWHGGSIDLSRFTLPVLLVAHHDAFNASCFIQKQVKGTWPVCETWLVHRLPTQIL